MEKKSASIRNCLTSLFACLFIAYVCSAPLCAKKKNKKDSKSEAAAEEQSAAVPGDTGTAIKIPVTGGRRTYFSDINEGVVSAVEVGSPATLKAAMSSLKSESETESNKVLFAVAQDIMRMVWKSEPLQGWSGNASGGGQSGTGQSGTAPDTAYTGAIASAKKGIYDTSTGNTDFLTTVLPSLVIAGASETAVLPYSDAAEAALKRGLALRPDSVLAKYLLALLYTKTARNALALPLLEECALASPDSKEISFATAAVLTSLEKSAQASRLLDTLLRRYPSDADVLALCAKSAYSLKDYSAAEGYVERLLQQVPNNTEYILLRAKILVALGDYMRAASMLDIYARQDTAAKEYLLLRARVQRDWSGNMSAATATCEDALRRYPKDPSVLLMAASIASATGGSVGGRSASSLADEALSLDPASDEAKRYKINALVDSAEWGAAYRESTAYMKEHSGERDALLTHVRICLEAGRGEEAFSLISPLQSGTVPGTGSKDETVTRLYISSLRRTGRTGEALALINKSLESASPAMRSFYYYERSMMQGTQEAALADLRSSLIASPRNKDALFRLYQIYFDNRDYRKAQYYLKQVIALDRGNASMRRLDDELTRLVR